MTPHRACGRPSRPGRPIDDRQSDAATAPTLASQARPFHPRRPSRPRRAGRLARSARAPAGRPAGAVANWRCDAPRMTSRFFHRPATAAQVGEALNEPSRRPTGAAAPPPLDKRPGQPSSPHPPAVPVPARPRLAGWLTAATCIATGRPGRARHGRHHARASVKKSPTRPRAVAIIAGALLLLPRRLQSDDGLGRTTYVARGRVLSANSWYASGMCRAPAGRPAGVGVARHPPTGTTGTSSQPHTGNRSSTYCVP
jgi:hypothetical protein